MYSRVHDVRVFMCKPKYKRSYASKRYSIARSLTRYAVGGDGEMYVSVSALSSADGER